VRIVYLPYVETAWLPAFTGSAGLLPLLRDDGELRRLGTLGVFIDANASGGGNASGSVPLLAVPLNLNSVLDLPENQAFMVGGAVADADAPSLSVKDGSPATTDGSFTLAAIEARSCSAANRPLHFCCPALICRASPPPRAARGRRTTSSPGTSARCRAARRQLPTPRRTCRSTAGRSQRGEERAPPTLPGLSGRATASFIRSSSGRAQRRRTLRRLHGSGATQRWLVRHPPSIDAIADAQSGRRAR
jgi:hypothetical protein